MSDQLDRDDRTLIADILAGSREAFRQLVTRHQRQAYTVAYGFVGNHQDADDVAQEAFVLVFRKLHTYRGDAEFSTWLHRIVANAALTHVRRRSRHQERHVTLEHPDAEHLAEELKNDDPDRRRMIERVLHDLPTLQRAVVILRHLQGRSTRQVSETLGCSEGTVKTHLHRGLQTMKKKLEELPT
ncbi:MAG: hypothetical protein A2X67_01170 [Ignavibacteria bacterium GWA2_55_11]|nr:MAG: hypothetical protein A2X67_01170 [Ignavibacteria bacterium GWA2_55_11]OGU44364.1 MAG: hypothetical protein A2X68_12845 [Ignavibacteria bacterium GWC2_56_12]OGU63399.1 MAG: hypothetical protein A3C56_01420 [Ignavibacteria bacterium RIFCSPHIGHO2_02_FULL_56_12]OGU70460.1 MAG: hypothetical protein A3G43_03170 [Ignavibacteria bacterium RIFCSPLOWO2_12_FULL_56_21]OGU73911.1 MAG: hypothetical protein A3H45_14730 [Ignavibacteria bacterium RIFCSPLOWO2_02_FULL_55_14]HAV22817.1 hypothetical protei